MNVHALSTLLALASLPIAAGLPGVRLSPEPEPPEPSPLAPWLPPRRGHEHGPDLRAYDGPKVAHVETKGRSKGTRRSRKGGAR